VVACEPLHHLSAASDITIEVHARVIRFRVEGHIVGPGRGGSKSAKEETNAEAGDPNKNNDAPLA
jgi:hypothetical protein